jgi:hypothetical protein
MKKLIVITCLVLINNISNAQFFRNYINLYENNYEDNLGKLYMNKTYKKEGVKEVADKTFNAKNELVNSTTTTKFNINGVGYSYVRLNKKRKLDWSWTYHLIDTLNYDKVESIHKKDTFIRINIFNKNNKIIETKQYSKDHVNYFTNKYTYNDKNKLATSAGYRKGKQTYKNEFDYYENGSRKETKCYDKKGKLIKIYNYACEPTGTIEKKVTQENICKKRTYNSDSSYLEIFEGHDNKRHTARRIVKYSKDSLELEQTFYNNNDKETRRYVSEYKDRKTVKFQHFYKGKLVREYYYTYKPNGLAESYQSFNKKGKLTQKTVYEYSYF